MSEEQKVVTNEAGDPVELKCTRCGNTDPVLFDFIEDEPTRRSAKLVRDNGTLVFEGLIAQHYYEAAYNPRLECRNEVQSEKGLIAHPCSTELPIPAGMKLDYE